jgi:hypothetical protein
MLSLFDLGLTHMQMQEVAAADEVLVEAWLHAASAPKIKTPAGYFLTGLRSGDMPLSQNIDARRAAVRLAELWIVNAGLYMPTGEEVLHELFERNGSRLHPWYDDEDLRAATSAPIGRRVATGPCAAPRSASASSGWTSALIRPRRARSTARRS